MLLLHNVYFEPQVNSSTIQDPGSSFSSTFQDLSLISRTFQDQTDFLGLSRAWKI